MVLQNTIKFFVKMWREMNTKVIVDFFITTDTSKFFKFVQFV